MIDNPKICDWCGRTYFTPTDRCVNCILEMSASEQFDLHTHGGLIRTPYITDEDHEFLKSCSIKWEVSCIS